MGSSNSFLEPEVKVSGQ